MCIEKLTEISKTYCNNALLNTFIQTKEQSYFWESHSRLTTQNTPCFSCNLVVRYCEHPVNETFPKPVESVRH